jgi:tetratricopeptide (TPR) repeat protein
MIVKMNKFIAVICFLLLLAMFGGGKAQTVVSPQIGGQRWAIVIGIDDYDNLDHLNFAVNDTVWLCSALADACQFPRENIFPLVTDWDRAKLMAASEGPALKEDFWDWFGRQAAEPNHANLRMRLEWLHKKVKPGDLVFFHFSGHGVLLDGSGYLALKDAGTKDLRTNSPGYLSMSNLSETLRSLSAQSVIVVFDACRSFPSRSVQSGPTGIVSSTMADALSRNIVIRPSVRDKTEIAATLFSCKVGQASYEWPEKKHGFFTYFLTRGLLGAASDETGKVTLSSLEAYLARQVLAEVKDKLGREQVPWVAYEGTNPSSLVLAWSGLLPPNLHLSVTDNSDKSQVKTICVHDFVNIKEDEKLEYVSKGLAEGISSRLANASNIQVVERSQLSQVTNELNLQQKDFADDKMMRQLGSLVGAQYSVVGSFECEGVLKLNARAVNNGTGEVVGGVSRTSTDRNYLEALVAYEIAHSLGASLPEPGQSIAAQSVTMQANPSKQDLPVDKSSNIDTNVNRPTATQEDEAISLFDAGKYAEAFHVYCHISDSNLNDVRIHRRIERCAKLGQLERQFLTRYLELVDQHAESAVLRNYLGNAYLMIDPRDQDGKAEAQYIRAKELASDFAPPVNNLAIIAFRGGKTDAAESMFLQYLKLSPQDAFGWVNLGLFYLSRVETDPNDVQSFTDAKRAFDEAVRIDPGLPSAYKGKGRLYMATGRKAEALRDYMWSYALDRNQPWVRQQIEFLSWEQGEGRSVDTQKDDDFVPRGTIESGVIAELTRSTCAFIAQKKCDSAQALAKELCEKMPGNGLSWRLFAKTLAAQGKDEQAAHAMAEANRLLSR